MVQSFLKLDAFEFAYAGKDKCWTNSAAKAQHSPFKYNRVALLDALIENKSVGPWEILMKLEKIDQKMRRAKEQQLPVDTHFEEIPLDNLDAGLKTIMSVLGVKLGRQICRLGDGRVRDINDTSFDVHNIEKELQVECTAQKAAHAARIKIEEIMQKKLKIVGQKFNSTLQS
ncbi:Uncharacterized protein Adt_03622 [Abeliophyllum distichum]|uniref:Uncharacterized protein n=1 Tax=Abeliophyllum distichum TaxID=126358 RepID=A0ABD1VZ31_9LAMI